MSKTLIFYVASIPICKRAPSVVRFCRRPATILGGSNEPRYNAMETNQKNMNQTILPMKETDWTLLQLVDDKGLRYTNKFEDQLTRFCKKLEPIQKQLTDVQNSLQKSETDMHNSQKDLQREMHNSQQHLQTDIWHIKWGGGVVVAIFGFFCTLFGNMTHKLPQIGIALEAAAGVVVVLTVVVVALQRFCRFANNLGKPVSEKTNLSTSVSEKSNSQPLSTS